MRKVIALRADRRRRRGRHQRADGPDRHARADQRLPRRPAHRRGRGDGRERPPAVVERAVPARHAHARRRARARLAQRDARRAAHAPARLHRHRRRGDAGACSRCRSCRSSGSARSAHCSSAAGRAATRRRGGRARPSRGRAARRRAAARNRPRRLGSATCAASERSATREEHRDGDRRSDARAAAGGASGSGEVPAAGRIRRAGGRLRSRDLRAGRGLRGLLGRARRGAALGHQVGPGARLVEPAVRQVVRRRQAQRLLQLRRPPRRGRQRRPRRLPLARRGGRGARRHLRRPAPRRPEARQRAEGPGRREGRRRRDLPADDPRGRGGDARLRAHRRDPQRRLRRLQRRVGQGADRVLRGQGPDHRRRRAPQGQDGADQGAGRRGDRRPRGHDRRRPARRTTTRR